MMCACAEEDLVAAQELVSYLEGRRRQPCAASCSFAAPPLVAPSCRAVPRAPAAATARAAEGAGFLRDPWCRYQMLQAERAGAEGRTIPLMSGLSRAATQRSSICAVDGRGLNVASAKSRSCHAV